MGYYKHHDDNASSSDVTSAAASAAQAKIVAARVAFPARSAGGLSRTESSFANLDWLLVGSPP